MSRQQRGANAIEFALTLPAFLALVLGAMEYGVIFMTQAGLDNAVSIGCREGAMVDPLIGDPVNAADNKVQELSAYWCSETACDIDIIDSGGATVPTRTLECRISRDTNPVLEFVPAPLTLSSTSQYRLEWQRAN
jgi:TadE-like protein